MDAYGMVDALDKYLKALIKHDEGSDERRVASSTFRTSMQFVFEDIIETVTGSDGNFEERVDNIISRRDMVEFYHLEDLVDGDTFFELKDKIVAKLDEMEQHIEKMKKSSQGDEEPEVPENCATLDDLHLLRADLENRIDNLEMESE